MKKMTPKEAFMAAKMREIKEKGVRGKQVPNKQAIAIMLSEAKRKGYKI